MSKIQRYQVNQDYFKNINTAVKAYWLGFLMADGCVYKGASQNSYVLQINLKASDINILQRLNKAIKSTYPIIQYVVKSKKKNYNAVKLKISNTNFCKHLMNHGIIPRKSIVCKMPNIQDKLYSHFLRGYFDGDGCITKGKKNGWHFSIVGGRDILNTFKEYLERNNIRTAIYAINHSAAYALETSAIADIAKIYQLLYSHSHTFLNRKKDIFDNAYKTYLSRPAVMQGQ